MKLVDFFKEKLKSLRTSQGMNLRQAAEGIEIGESSLNKYELGSQFPPLKVLLKICKFYGVTLNDIMYPNEQERINNLIEEEILNRFGESYPNASSASKQKEMFENLLDEKEATISALKDTIEHERKQADMIRKIMEQTISKMYIEVNDIHDILTSSQSGETVKEAS